MNDIYILFNISFFNEKNVIDSYLYLKLKCVKLI